jgi:DNA-binding SARP family transcriptional activator
MPLRLALMGSFGLYVDDDGVRLPMSARRLVAFLALARRPVSRLYVAGHLWSDVPEARAAASLRSALWRTLRVAEVVRADADALELSSHVAVDVTDALALARRAQDTAVPVAPHDVAALVRTDDLLPDWYDEPWLDLERECFRKLRLRALERVCEGLIADGRLGEALEAGLAAVAADPLRESAHRALIRTHLAEGNAAEALRQFHAWRRLSERMLGLPPSAALLHGPPAVANPVSPL